MICVGPSLCPLANQLRGIPLFSNQEKRQASHPLHSNTLLFLPFLSLLLPFYPFPSPLFSFPSIPSHSLSSPSLLFLPIPSLLLPSYSFPSPPFSFPSNVKDMEILFYIGISKFLTSCEMYSLHRNILYCTYHNTAINDSVSSCL